jgi:hypothetical protein
MKKLFLILAFISPFAFTQPSSSQENRPNYSITKWQSVTPSLTDFLNGGWKLVGQSSHRVMTVRPGATDDIITYAYTLSKDGKYVTCFISNAVVNETSYSGCRALN